MTPYYNYYDFIYSLETEQTLKLLLFSHHILSNSLQPHGLQHARLPCSSPSLGVCPSSCLSQPLSITLFSFCLQSFPASGSFPTSQLLASGGQSTGASASVLPVSIQGWFPLRLTGLISLLSKGLSSLFQHHSSKASIPQVSAFFMVQFSHLYMTARSLTSKYNPYFDTY